MCPEVLGGRPLTTQVLGSRLTVGAGGHGELR